MKWNINISLKASVADDKDIMHTDGLLFIDIHHIKFSMSFVVI